MKPPSPQTEMHGPVRRGELGAQHAAHPETHRREAPAVQHALRPLRLPELHEPVVMDARIEGQDRVVGQHALQRVDDVLGAQRGRDVGEMRPHEGFPLGLPAGDLGAPLRELRGVEVALRFHRGQELRGEHLGVGDDAERRRIVAPELLRIDVDVQELRLREIPRIAGMPGRRRAVVEARADRDHQVGVPARLVRRVGPVAADEAQRQRIVGGHATHRIGRGDDGNAERFGQRGDLGSRFGQRRAVADEQRGLARLREQRQRRRDVGIRRAGPMRTEDRRGRRNLDVVLLLEDVVRHVEVHRARAPGQHGVERLAQRERQHVDPRRLERALDDRAQHRREVGLVVLVDLLERRAVGLRGRHVGGDREQRRGIRQRGRQRHRQVGRTRAGRRERGDGLVPDAEIRVGHVARALLVPRRDQLHLIADLVERIEDPHVAVAADPEHVRNLLADQVFGDQLAAFHLRHGLCSRYSVAKVTMRSSVISRTA